MSFRKFLNEEVQGINENGIGRLITYTLYMTAQVHVWHLLCPSGQKHTALGELYDELQSEVDELAEKFIAQGGYLTTITEPIIAMYSEEVIRQKCDEYRTMITSCINRTPEMESIMDGVVDLQEIVDAKLYKFNLQ